jgi:hypothetical protein
MLKPKSSQSSGCTHISKQAKKFETDVACQEADGSCFLGQERSANGGIHATRDHNNITSVLQNTEKSTQDHSEQKAWNADMQCCASP